MLVPGLNEVLSIWSRATAATWRVSETSNGHLWRLLTPFRSRRPNVNATEPLARELETIGKQWKLMEISAQESL